NKSLKDLWISHVKIDVELAQEIAEVLKTNKTLKKLGLWSTWMDNDQQAVSVIANALKENQSLVELGLSNAVGEKGVLLIADMLKTNTTLARVFLHFNLVGEKQKQAIEEALKINKTVKVSY